MVCGACSPLLFDTQMGAATGPAIPIYGSCTRLPMLFPIDAHNITGWNAPRNQVAKVKTKKLERMLFVWLAAGTNTPLPESLKAWPHQRSQAGFHALKLGSQ